MSVWGERAGIDDWINTAGLNDATRLLSLTYYLIGENDFCVQHAQAKRW